MDLYKRRFLGTNTSKASATAAPILTYKQPKCFLKDNSRGVNCETFGKILLSKVHTANPGLGYHIIQL